MSSTRLTHTPRGRLPSGTRVCRGVQTCGSRQGRRLGREWGGREGRLWGREGGAARGGGGARVPPRGRRWRRAGGGGRGPCRRSTAPAQRACRLAPAPHHAENSGTHVSARNARTPLGRRERAGRVGECFGGWVGARESGARGTAAPGRASGDHPWAAASSPRARRRKRRRGSSAPCRRPSARCPSPSSSPSDSSRSPRRRRRSARLGSGWHCHEAADRA